MVSTGAKGVARLVPGIALCAVISLIAIGLQHVEEAWTGRPWLEALVIAILLGTVVRTAWNPGERFTSGIVFSAKTLLEIAVMLLGASISFQAVLQAGAGLILGIAVVVAVAIGASYGLCRLLGLPSRMAVLVACGNSICGNSAIAAVAPVIGAKAEDVASSIAFTAILGVIVVLALPLLVPVLGLSEHQYGVLAGLTVYAVPQVLAATVPVGIVSTQIGTLVKLVRVLMLGPVVILLSVLAHRAEKWPRFSAPNDAPLEKESIGSIPKVGSTFGSDALAGRNASATKTSLSFNRLVPWFITGFLGLAALRSWGLIPDAVLGLVMPTATILTVISMAALGLGVDLKVLGRVGGRVTLAVTLSLLVLIAISLGLIRLIGVV